MLNDILIDKLRIFMPREKKHLLYGENEDFEAFSSRLSRYFPKKACRMYSRYKYFFIELNPTRFKSFSPSNKFDNDFNLQMIPENILLDVL